MRWSQTQRGDQLRPLSRSRELGKHDGDGLADDGKSRTTRRIVAKKDGPGMGRINTQSLLSYVDPSRRSATVEEQVSIMLFLLSDEASNYVGGIYATDGGWTSCEDAIFFGRVWRLRIGVRRSGQRFENPPD
jgi:hypothetical protein